MNIRWFTYFILIYLLAAISWWTLLLYNKNDQVFRAQLQIDQLEKTKNTELISDEHRRQKLMILGEGVFIAASLIAGIWLINRGNRREIESINRQNNFLLAITHELKSPLASVKLVLHTLSKRKLSPKQSTDLVKTAATEIKRLESMIENLLLTSNADQFNTIAFQSVDLEQVIFELLQEMRNKFDDISFDYVKRIETKAKVKGDQKLLSIAIKNILDNAWKYASPSEIVIELTQNDSEVRLSIADQGKGISDKEKKLVFDRFYRSGKEIERSSKGTGIGLYITKGIVSAHMGKIKIKDNEPSGTIFEINLPKSD